MGKFQNMITSIGSAARIPAVVFTFSLMMFILCIAILLRHATASSATATADILKGLATLAWPGVGFYAVYMFRDELRYLMRRVKKASISEVLFVEAAAAQALAPISDSLPLVDPTAARNAVIVMRSQRLRDDLDRIEPETAKQSERETRLIAALATHQAMNFYFRLNLSIFGSQIEALERASTAPAWIDLRPFFEAHVERYKQRVISDAAETPPYAFDDWVRYLTNNQLLEMHEERGKITTEGRDFLEFVAALKLPRIYVW